MTDLREMYPVDVVAAFEGQQAEIDAGRRKQFSWAGILLNHKVAALWRQWRDAGDSYTTIAERSGFPISAVTVAHYMKEHDRNPGTETAVADPEPGSEPVRAQTPPQRTAAELEDLKAQWEADPCWDIEETEGFEAHYDELFAYRKQKIAEWEQARHETAVLPTPANGTHEETTVSRADGVAGLTGLTRLLRELRQIGGVTVRGKITLNLEVDFE